MRPLSLLALVLTLAVACMPTSPGIATAGNDASSALDPLTDDASSAPGDDSAFDVPWDAGGPAPAFDASAGPPPLDASAPPPPADGGAPGDATIEAGDAPQTCTQALGPGVLTIDELMIASEAGSGDYGEWLEVASTVGCAVDLRGLYAESPTGTTVISLAVTSDLWLPPYGTFLIADSLDPAINHSLPGALLAWSGNHGDVLRDEGGTVTLSVDGAILLALTYPSLKLTDGASVEFPASCPSSRFTDWTAWQTATSSWFPGFRGTPNAPNTDVICP